MMPGRAQGADSIADEGIIAGDLPGVLNAIKRSARARNFLLLHLLTGGTARSTPRLPPSLRLTTSARREARSIQISRHTRERFTASVGALSVKAPARGRCRANCGHSSGAFAGPSGNWTNRYLRGKSQRTSRSDLGELGGHPVLIATFHPNQTAHESLDRPPDHRGDHTRTTKLFLDLLVNGP